MIRRGIHRKKLTRRKKEEIRTKERREEEDWSDGKDERRMTEMTGRQGERREARVRAEESEKEGKINTPSSLSLPLHKVKKRNVREGRKRTRKRVEES